MSYFIKYIQDYDSIINYDIAHNKAAYKYFFNIFYNKKNYKKYKS